MFSAIYWIVNFLQLCRVHSQLTQYADRYKWVYTQGHTMHSFRNSVLSSILLLLFMFSQHQEQTEGKEPDVHQTDSVCDWGACPGAGRWVCFVFDYYCQSARWVGGEIAGQCQLRCQCNPCRKGGAESTEPDYTNRLVNTVIHTHT